MNYSKIKLGVLAFAVFVKSTLCGLGISADASFTKKVNRNFGLTEQLDSVPVSSKRLPRKLTSVDYLSWRPAKDTLGIFPFHWGSNALPLSIRGTAAVGYMISNESHGFHVRIDNPYRIRTVNYPRKSKSPKIRTRSKGLEFGYYSHPSLHRNLYLLGTKQWKFQRKKHWQYTLSVGVGYSRTFLTSPTYVFKNNEFRRVPLAGYHYLALQAGTTLEYRLKQNASVYLGYNLLGLTPYNKILMPRMQFQMGCTVPVALFNQTTKHRPK